MGYYETYCQLCGVSPAIARIRTPYEPLSAAHSYSSITGFVAVEEDELCDPAISGCYRNPRLHRFGEDDDQMWNEHVAGPGCVSSQGYSGFRIAESEMKGCRDLCCLVLKEEGWVEEEGDQDWEREADGKYFLTGCGDGSPDEGPLENLRPVRHGVTETWPFNTLDGGDEGALPLHPTCFEIFKRVSMDRLGKVDVHGLWSWRANEPEDFDAFPRGLAVKGAREQWWNHEVGHEWLAANPVEVPGFDLLLKSCFQETRWGAEGKPVPYDVHQGALNFVYTDPSDTYPRAHSIPPPAASNPSDIFMRLPQELLYMITSSLSSKDVANLRLVTSACRQLPIIFFRQLLLKEMPWLWEARDLPVGTTNWYKLWTKMMVSWRDLKGVKNRRRIWKDVNEVVRRIEWYRGVGMIVDA